MNTEPPTGDDLQRMLVSMKQNVLDRAEERRPAPRRRGRRAGIVIGVIALLGLGATSGAVALGMVPQPFAAAPAPSPSVVAPSETPTRSSAPVVNEPTSTPTPTPTRRPYDAADPSTWTISGDEVGPVALGGETSAELDDLVPPFTRDAASTCPNPDAFLFSNGQEQSIWVQQTMGLVSGVLLSRHREGSTSFGTGPTTAEGIGVGSTVEELRDAYPALVQLNADQTSGQTIDAVGGEGRWVSFVIGEPDRVTDIWVGSEPVPPYEWCG